MKNALYFGKEPEKKFWIPKRTNKFPFESIITKLKYQANGIFLRCLLNIIVFVLLIGIFLHSHILINPPLGIKLLRSVAEIKSTS